MSEVRVSPATLVAALNGDIGNVLVAATPGGIERQEKAGQTAFVTCADEMPVIMRPSVEAYRRLGFEFGNSIDELFAEAKLPKGWLKKASPHSMWSAIVDEQGRERVHVFYKAAFYDRRAHAQLARRYVVESVYDDENLPYSEQTETIVVKDGGDIIKIFGTCLATLYEVKEGFYRDAEAWLKDKFPDHDDPTAYW